VKSQANKRRLLRLACALIAVGVPWMAVAQSGIRIAVDLANPLVGTAPLDQQELIGNAPPSGEPVYSGQISPGARLRHSSVEVAAINNNIALSFPNGVAVPYYDTNPTSSDDYIIGSPLFDKVKLVMGNGRNLELIARNNSTGNMYIQSATLNGNPWTKPWFSHADIKDGAVLVLNMGPIPIHQGGAPRMLSLRP
jgi:Glycosyl hydrolase family 92